MFSYLVSTYGSLLVAGMIALECVGIPLPGETVLVAAAIYAGTTHKLDINIVVVAAALGGVIGNIGGYLIGRELGYRLLIRHGHYLGLNESRIKIGRYLFRRYGLNLIVLARFVAVLRSVAGILAGANHMPWPPFLLATILGAILWTGVYGFGAFYLGDNIHRLAAPAGIAVACIAAGAIFFGMRALARREKELQAEAERTFPGPLQE